MKFCLFVVALIVSFFAVLAKRPDLVLPHKIHAAVSMKGWEGFSKLVVANVAQRQLGQRHTKSREAWYRLLESLRDVDVKYLAPTADVVTEEEVAQGHEFVLHLLSIGLEAYVINADPTRPRFKNLFNPEHKWLVDQPDAVYLTATIATGLEYIIDGRRADATNVYLSFTVYTHERGGGWSSNVLTEAAYPRSSVSGLNFTPDPSTGAYRLYVSATKPARTLRPNEQWLRIPKPGDASSGPGEVSILGRFYFEGEVSVQTYGPKGGRALADVDAEIAVVEPSTPRSRFPPIPTDENVAQRIDFVSNFLIDHTIVNAPGGEKSKAPGHRIPDWYSITPNVIGKPDLFIQTASGIGAPDVHYAAGPWKLAPHEALVIEGVMPSKDDCVFANVLLINKFLQSLDYQHGRSQHFNRRQIKGMGADGSYKLVLAHDDPGPAYNWLDTEGRETGIVFYRYFLATVDLAQAVTRVVNFAEL